MDTVCRTSPMDTVCRSSLLKLRRVNGALDGVMDHKLMTNSIGSLKSVTFVKGMRCPLSDCTKCTCQCFQSEAQFIEHWKHSHQPHIVIYVCLMCFNSKRRNVAYTTAELIRKHLSSKHRMTSCCKTRKLEFPADMVCREVHKNPYYTDPWPYVFKYLDNGKWKHF